MGRGGKPGSSAPKPQLEGLLEIRADLGVFVNLVFFRTALLEGWTILRTFGFGGRGQKCLGFEIRQERARRSEFKRLIVGVSSQPHFLKKWPTWILLYTKPWAWGWGNVPGSWLFYNSWTSQEMKDSETRPQESTDNLISLVLSVYNLCSLPWLELEISHFCFS